MTGAAAATDTRDAAPRRHAGAMLAIALAVFAGAASMRCLDALLPVIAAGFGRSVGLAGGAVSAYALSYSVFQLVHGPLADRVGAYRVIAGAACLSAIGAVACAMAPSLSALITLRMITGAVAGAVGPLALAWVSRSSVANGRPIAFARVTAAAILGTAAGQAGGGVIGGAAGWPAVFMSTAVLFATSGLSLILLAHHSPDVVDGAVAVPTRAPVKLLALLHRGAIVRVLVTVACEGFAIGLSLPYAGGLLHDAFAITSWRAGLLISLYGVGGIAFVLTAPRLLRWSSIALRARSAGVVMALGFGGLALASSVASAAAALFAIGFGFLMLHNVLQVEAAQAAPDAVGTTLSLFAAASCLAQALGAAAGGALFDRAGPTTGCWLSAAVLIALGNVIATPGGRRLGGASLR